MKTVFNNRQLAHVWAQQSQPEGRGSSFFFSGPSIYSYGRHFEIARFITRKGARAVLFTTRSYSVSTAKHVSATHNALYGHNLPLFHVADIDDAARGGDATREDYRRRVSDALESAAKRRRPELAAADIERARRLAAEANDYAAFFGKRWRIKLPADTAEALERLREQAKRNQARQRAADAARKAREDAEYAEALAEWRRHERDTLPDSHLRPVALRVTQRTHGQPADIETTRGALVPATVARMVWDAVTATRESGNEWRPPFGHDRPRLGSFTLDRIGPDGTITAGCHVIPYSELHALAVRFGFVS